MRVGLALAVLVVTAGCRFGSAGFTGTLVDRSFDPTGTVFGYVDGHDDALVADPDDDPPVALMMTWLVFDASRDLSDLDGATLASYAHELRLRDALSLVFAARSLLLDGGTLESEKLGDDEQGDGSMEAFIHLQPERLDATKTYADFVPYGGKRVVRVELDQVDFDAEKVVAGRVSIAFARGDGDPEDVKEGAINGSFRAPLVEERIAEKNLALLDVHDVLGLPLSAPGEAAP